jgi:hypothetical protein
VCTRVVLSLQCVVLVAVTRVRCLWERDLQESEHLKSSSTPTLANKSGGGVPVNYEFWGGCFIELHIAECVYVSCVFAVYL